MDAFTELGTRVAKEWGKYRYGTAALPDVAASELAREPLHEKVDYESILDNIGSSEMIPFQVNTAASFGEPPLTMFWHPDFYIEALFWASSTTAIHGHGFVGAFQVLAGTSLQSLFEFEGQEPKTGRCRMGQLRQTHAALLRPGATQMIKGAEQFIHSIFHLGYPSVTIVVRTQDRSVGTQYEYRRPGVALSHGYERSFDQLTTRLLQVARLEAVLRSNRLRTITAKIGTRGDLAACFRLLELVQPVLSMQGRLEVMAEVVATLAEAIGPTYSTKLSEALTRERQLTPLRLAREVVVEDDLRLFLALLLTQQERRFVMPMVTDYTDDPEPSRLIAGWIRKLAAKAVLKVPTDEETERLLAKWLAHGPETALREAQAGEDGHEARRRIDQLTAEPLLAPLLLGTETPMAAMP
jgi:hypothetical protein